ncbi:OmpA family protein [Myroides pelagicus]|uniref:OmpA family protein n=1 Tax=Myroides pelagicus TaxID=270914 RepID=A0A7K1GPE7_9FLAO|nr:OmpA family protein [Myroides pelagicus]MEC4113853.1 OmpA family protein [Myroides pelagicus]MTH30648.1 OmpA family protein [Myroides pelagicus]
MKKKDAFRLCLLLLMSLLMSSNVLAKGKPSLKKADKYYKNTEYSKAAEEYKRLERGSRHTDPYIYQQLAICYDKLDRVIEASTYYGKAIAKMEKQDPELIYSYAKVLQKSGRYEVARDMMDDFTELVPNDSRARDFAKNPDAYYELSKLKEYFGYQESGMNDRYYDTFGALMTKNDTIYFVSNRTKQENKFARKLFEVRDRYKRMPNYDIYQATFTAVKEPIFKSTRLLGTINKRFNDGRAVASLDGERMFFASESYRYRRFRKNPIVKKRDRMMSLFVAKRKGTKWRKVKKLPFTRPQYMYTSPSISPDGKYLYFASDMEGSHGVLDIWRVALLEDEDYGEPENLGAIINSGTINEDPFLSEDNVLYFTSDRWGGFGGKDIYMVDMNTPNAKPVNVGQPINTALDDYAFSYYPSKGIGFFSSNRIGRNDIYKVTPSCKRDVKVIVKNKKFNKPVSNALVKFSNSKRRIEDEAVTDDKGVLEGYVTCAELYKVVVSHPDYLDEELEVKVSKDEEVETLIAYLRPLEELMIEEDRITLEPIHFAFDQKEITIASKFELDKLVKLMKRYPTMRIKVNSHTDSKGNPDYNLKLSQNRADATVEYLVSQGITKDRLESEGYGDKMLKIQCAPCDEAQDAQNRRSEFLILSR